MHKTFSSLKESLVEGKKNIDNLLEQLPILERIQEDIDEGKSFPVLIYFLVIDGRELYLDGHIGYVDEIILQTVLPEGYVSIEDQKIYLDDGLISIPVKFKDEKHKNVLTCGSGVLKFLHTNDTFCLLDGGNKVAYGWVEIDNLIKSVNPKVENFECEYNKR